MVQFLVHNKVEDYKNWKPFFDEHASFRAKHGSKSAKVFRCKEDANDVLIFFEWDSLENAQKFMESDELKKTMKEAGVIGKPNIYFVEK
jgi:heme-degrading monooxygenase HmoA